jgi:GAF domain-containing protein
MAATTAGASKRAVRRRSNGDAGLLQRREAELAAMAARQAATLEILKTISASPDDPQPVFELIARRARELCGAAQASVSEYDGELVHLRATEGYTSSFPTIYPRAPDPGNVHGRLVLEGAVIHIRNLAAEPDGYYRDIAQRLGTKSLLGVPLLREGRVIGGIVLRRTETGGFDDAQVALVQSFAEQAVIAIASAQTRRDLAARNEAYSEQVTHQAATIDVLKVMSSSTSDTQPVFDIILRRAMQLCNCMFGGMYEYDGELMHVRAAQGFVPGALENFTRQFPMAPTRTIFSARAILDRLTIRIRDIDAEPNVPRTSRELGYRSMLAVPLLRDGAAIGVISLAHKDIDGFSDAHVELLKTFAEQAVIAIGSVATFRALQQRTRDLSQSLEQQTATAEVLKVINSSPGDLAPVFDAILEKAHSLCDAPCGSLQLYDGQQFRAVAARGMPDDFVEMLRRGFRPPIAASEHTQPVQIPDMAEAAHRLPHDPVVRDTVQIAGIRTFLAVPLRRDGSFLGRIVAARREVRPFTDKQIALLENFAAQAVIAMENARLLTEQREALEQQTATAEVLQVINTSPGNLAPVFDAMLEKAIRLCDSAFGVLWTYDGDGYCASAVHGAPPAFVEFVRQPQRPPFHPGSGLGRILRGEEVAIVNDMSAEEIYRSGDALRHALVDLGGARSAVTVSLRKDVGLLGAFTIYRQEVRPFSDKQITLLQNFTAQAVIAMENARLLTEQQEALEQQTATAEVLQVINASPGDLTPVFEAMLEKALRLCDSAFGMLATYDGECFHTVATRGVNAALAELAYRPQRPVPGLALYRIAQGEDVVQIADITDDEAYRLGIPGRRAIADLGGARTQLLVALRKDGALVGTFNIYRQEVRPFTEKQIGLLQNFAAQAVIAMENARLLTEQREALERQTATADILRVISRSPTDSRPVFEAISKTAVRLLECARVVVLSCDAASYSPVAVATPEGLQEDLGPTNVPIDPAANFPSRAILDKRTLYLPDWSRIDLPEHQRHMRDRHQANCVLYVPMLRQDECVGVLCFVGRRVNHFNETAIALAESFADQAVIAIENARLFDAVQERTRELARSVAELQALEEVLRAVNSSLDLETVLATIIGRAVRLSQADEGTIYEFGAAEEVFVPKAALGMSDERIAWLRERRIRIGEAFLGRSALRREPVHVADVQQDPSTPEAAEILPGIHAVLAVPLLQGEKVIGGMVIRRRSEGAFAPNTVTLLQTFAGQSVLAIENARLFQEAERARGAAETALTELRRAQDRLIQSEKMASLGQLTAGIAHEIKNPLNFVNNFSALSGELIDELRDVLANAAIDGPTRAEVEELGVTIKGNLEKVVQHGKRADAIVKNMLLHARESGGERRSVDLNATVEEALNLAYHGARAEHPGFNITLVRDFDPAVGSVELYPQEFTRVMLNLISNGFYAATHKARAGAGADFQPTLAVTTEARGDAVLIRVRDNGIGIPDSARGRLFEPFFTTKPAGEGTGLGLSISHDIVVKQHGGSIAVDSMLGEYTEFTVTLPRL